MQGLPGIFLVNYVSTVADFDPCGTRISAAMILPLKDRQVVVEYNTYDKNVSLNLIIMWNLM